MTFSQASQKNCAIFQSFHFQIQNVFMRRVLPICVDSYKNSHISKSMDYHHCHIYHLSISEKAVLPLKPKIRKACFFPTYRGFRSKRSNSWPQQMAERWSPTKIHTNLTCIYRPKKNTFMKSGLSLTNMSKQNVEEHIWNMWSASSFSLESKRNMFVCIHICNRKQWKCCPHLPLHFQLGSDWELPVLRKHIHKKHVSRWQRSEFRQRTFVLSKKWSHLEQNF